MKLVEYNKVKELDYRGYCKYLQDKYGMAPKAYFHTTGQDNHLTGGNVSRGKEGLQCHHICEDLVASLSDKNVAIKNDMFYQQPENLCYANLLEHFFLHILIAEEQKQNDDGTYLGDGGVNWIVLALNSIYSDPSNSWYSKKIENPEEKGLSYNYNNIITDNRDTFLALVNRYCTSSFIRIKQDLTNEELGMSLCHTCKKDTNTHSIYNDIIKASKDTFVFDWNVEAYADLETYLKTHQSALVKICTGGGKTTTGLEYIRMHNCKALVLGSGNTIEDSWLRKDKEGNVNQFNAEHIDYMNYQSFMNCYEVINWDKYQVVICDEAHHIKAEKWGEGIRWLLQNKHQVKIIGLTATPNPQQTAGTDEEFNGRICYGLDLANGIKENIIYPFDYIQSIYKMESVKDDFAKYGATGKLLWDRLNIQASQNPIEKILRDNMKEGIRKIVVFIQNIKDKDEVINALIKYDQRFANEEYLRFISSKDSDYAKEAKEWFNNTNDHTVVLVSRDMVNEGAHYDGVNTLIMFRSTKSNRLFLQQLGRIVVTVANHDNPNGIVFDFTNNAQTLIHRNKSVYQFVTEEKKEEKEEEKEENKSDDTNEVEKIITVIQDEADKSDSPVIFKDYTEDCVNVLSSLKDSQNKDASKNRIFSAYMEQLSDINLTAELFKVDLWSEAKTEAGDNMINIQRRKGNGFGLGSCNTQNTSKKKTEVVQRGKMKASDIEKVVMAITLLLKRSYDFGAIDFENNSKCDLKLIDKDLFSDLSNDLGFIDSSKMIKVLQNLNQLAFITATNV